MSSKFIVPLKLLELNATPAFIVSDWHNLYYKAGYLKTYKTSEKDVVLDRPLDGFAPTVCTPIVATDTVLEAFEKVQCQITDIVDNYQLSLCKFPLNFKEGTVGPKVSFTKQDYADPTIVKDVIIPSVLEITRGDNQGIYNAALQSSYSGPGPTNTLWSSPYTNVENSTWGPVENVFNKTYSNWITATDGVPTLQVNTYMILKETTQNRYWLIKFNSWTPQGAGGGFSYDRWEIPAPVSFTRPDNQPSIVDYISSGVAIARLSNGGAIFNSLIETQNNIGLSPKNTKWNSVYTDNRPGYSGFGDLSNITKRVYKDFVYALDYAVNYNILNTPLIMHDLTTDLYYMITFTSWTSGGNGGGFSYTRQIIPQSCGVKFADGSVLNSGAFSTSSQQIIDVSGSSLYSTNPAAGPGFSTDNGIFLGAAAGQNSNGSYRSIFLGLEAGRSSNAGDAFFAGTGAGKFSTNCYSSFFIGTEAGMNANNTYRTICMGFRSGYDHDNSQEAVMIGHGSGAGDSGLFPLAYGNDASVFIGALSGNGAKNSRRTVAIGYFTSGGTQNNDYSSMIGFQAGLQSSSNNSVSMFGQEAGRFASSNGNCEFIGAFAGYITGQTVYSSFIGYAAGANTSSANYSFASGYEAARYAQSMNYTIAIGYQSAKSSSSAYQSVMIGYLAGTLSTNSSRSNYIGTLAGYNSSCSSTNMIGEYAGYAANNCGSSNFIGVEAGKDAVGSSNASFIGKYAGTKASNSLNAVFIGGSAGQYGSNSTSSVFIGSAAGWGEKYPISYYGSSSIYTSGSAFSTFVGDLAGAGANAATYTTALGKEAGAGLGGYITKVSAGSYNIFVGVQSGAFATTSSNVNFIGYRAGLYLSNSNYIDSFGTYSGYGSYLNNNSIFIGYYSGSGSNNLSDSIFIGKNSGTNATSSNVTAIGANVAQSNAIPNVVILASSQLQSYPDEIAAQAGFAALGTLVAGNSYLFYNTTTKCIGVVKY